MLSGTSLAGRITFTILTLVLASISLSALVFELELEHIVAGKERSRFTLQADAVTSVVEDSLGIGLPLRELATLEQVLDQRREGDPLILQLTIFDARGARLHDTDRTAAGDVPRAWVQLAEVGGGQLERSLVIRPVRDVDQAVVGGIALRYDERSVHQIDTSIRIILGQAIFEVILPAAIVTVAGVALIMSGTARRLGRARRSLLDVATGDAPPAADEPMAVAFARTLDTLELAVRDLERDEPR